MNYHKILINLDRRTDRLANFKRNFNYDFDRISAIDGKELSIKDNNLCYKNKIIFENAKFFKNIKKGEIGCFLSHKLAWEKVIEKNEPCIIFEDDVEPLLPLNNIIDISKNNIDILYLGMWTKYDQERFYQRNPTLIDNNKHKGYFPYFNQKRQLYPYSYLLTPTGAKKLLDMIPRISQALPLDHFIHYVMYNQEKIIYPYRCFAPQGNSDIQGKHNFYYL